MAEVKPNEPSHRLIERCDAVPACQAHHMEELQDLNNSEDWLVDIQPPDILRYECQICHSVRVYKVIHEKTNL